MTFPSTMLTLVRWAVLLPPAMLSSAAIAQEVFRETTYNYGAPDSAHFAERDPDSKRKFEGEHAGMATMKLREPKSVTLDLAGATRAELSAEFWGGHIGSASQSFSVNDHGWIQLAQPAGTPTEPQRFYRTLLGNNASPIPLDQLKDGENVFRFTVGKQIAYANDWAFYWIYDFTTRVYYDPALKPHPTGELIVWKGNPTFDDLLRLDVKASSPNGEIARVDYIGEYDDFDWDGDGVWREWQYSTHHGVLRHHLGTVDRAPWSLKADVRWLPDQSQPVRVRARITDRTGLTYLTPPVEFTQRREHRGVRLIKCDIVPEKWMSRGGRESPQGGFTLTEADLAGATFARLVLSSWSGDVEDTSVHELRLNGQRLAGRPGEFHNYAQNALEVPLDRLKVGANEITVFSTFKGHMFEINWPGPVLLIECKK